MYDIVFVSKVFTFSKGYDFPIYTKEIIKGGTGYDLDNKLPEEVESICPDYSLYGIKNTAYGFLTRGCFRNCPFCIVSRKENQRSTKVADLESFWRGQPNIKLLDPNLLACADRVELLHQLLESNVLVDFTQGLDARLLDDETMYLLTKIKSKRFHFAWDFESESDAIIKKLQDFKQYSGFDKKKLSVYVLTNFNTDFSFDLYRVYRLKELGYDPYIMIYDKPNALRNVRLLQRWVNNKFIFRTVEKFEDYNPKLG
ncbi:radical SAM protein [Clostridia bacterium]|nr:radical SAM protein [Clostridia bacterium]